MIVLIVLCVLMVAFVLGAYKIGYNSLRRERRNIYVPIDEAYVSRHAKSMAKHVKKDNSTPNSEKVAFRFAVVATTICVVVLFAGPCDLILQWARNFTDGRFKEDPAIHAGIVTVFLAFAYFALVYLANKFGAHVRRGSLDREVNAFDEGAAYNDLHGNFSGEFSRSTMVVQYAEPEVVNSQRVDFRKEQKDTILSEEEHQEFLKIFTIQKDTPDDLARKRQQAQRTKAVKANMEKVFGIKLD